MTQKLELHLVIVRVIACKQCSSNEQLVEASRVLHATSLSKCMSMHCFTYVYSYHHKTVPPGVLTGSAPWQLWWQTAACDPALPESPEPALAALTGCSFAADTTACQQQQTCMPYKAILTSDVPGIASTLTARPIVAHPLTKVS